MWVVVPLPLETTTREILAIIRYWDARAGPHLNIRSPLDQGTAQGNDILELAHSQDPLHRAYLLEAGRKGGRAFVSNVRERTRQKILAGGPFMAHKKFNGELRIWFQYVEICLGYSHNVPLASKSVRVHMEIISEGQSHPQCWAKCKGAKRLQGRSKGMI